jgi:hypothetical protein
VIAETLTACASLVLDSPEDDVRKTRTKNVLDFAKRYKSAVGSEIIVPALTTIARLDDPQFNTILHENLSANADPALCLSTIAAIDEAHYKPAAEDLIRFAKQQGAYETPGEAAVIALSHFDLYSPSAIDLFNNLIKEGNGSDAAQYSAARALNKLVKPTQENQDSLENWQQSFPNYRLPSRSDLSLPPRPSKRFGTNFQQEIDALITTPDTAFAGFSTSKRILGGAQIVNVFADELQCEYKFSDEKQARQAYTELLPAISVALPDYSTAIQFPPDTFGFKESVIQASAGYSIATQFHLPNNQFSSVGVANTAIYGGDLVIKLRQDGNVIHFDFSRRPLVKLNVDKLEKK